MAPVAQRGVAANSSALPLAKYASFNRWKPQIGDFVVWHGWISRWYGVVNAIDRDELLVVKENLPCLLFSLAESEYAANTIRIPIVKVLRSQGGEYHILQGDTWYIE